MKEEPSVTDGKRICSGHSPDARIPEESSSKRLPAQQYGEHAFRERPIGKPVFKPVLPDYFWTNLFSDLRNDLETVRKNISGTVR